MKQGEDVDVGKAVSGGVEEQDMKNLDNLLGEMEQELIEDFFHTWRASLEAEDCKRLLPLVSLQCAEKRKEFGAQRGNTNSNTVHSSMLMSLDDLDVMTTDDENEESSESDDENHQQRNDLHQNQAVLRNRNSSYRNAFDSTDSAGGAISLANHLDPNHRSKIRTIDKEEEMPKAERKKLLKIVQQFLKSIKSKEKRKKTKKVLTKIAKQAKSRDSMMGLLANKIVKTNKVFGANIDDIVKVIFVAFT